MMMEIIWPNSSLSDKECLVPGWVCVYVCVTFCKEASITWQPFCKEAGQPGSHCFEETSCSSQAFCESTFHILSKTQGHLWPQKTVYSKYFLKPTLEWMKHSGAFREKKKKRKKALSSEEEPMASSNVRKFNSWFLFSWSENTAVCQNRFLYSRQKQSKHTGFNGTWVELCYTSWLNGLRISALRVLEK